MQNKICPACQRTFECQVDNIYNCQCYQIELSHQQKEMIANLYNDCLCSACLNQIKTLNPIKE